MNRLEKEKQQIKGELDDLKASVDHLSKDKVMSEKGCIHSIGCIRIWLTNLSELVLESSHNSLFDTWFRHRIDKYIILY